MRRALVLLGVALLAVAVIDVAVRRPRIATTHSRPQLLSTSVPPELRPVVEKLMSGDPAQRVAGLRELEVKGNAAAAAIPFLVLLLGDETRMRVEGSEAGGIGFFSSPGALAASLLARMDEAGMNAMSRVLHEGNPLARRNAVRGLGHMRGPRVADALVLALSDSDALVRETARRSIADLGEAAIEPLLEMLRHADEPLRLRIIRTLGQFTDPDALDAVAEAMGDRSPRVRRAALEVLAESKDLRVQKALIAALADEELQGRAATGLAGLGDHDVVTSLIRVLRNESDPRARRGAAFALSMLRDPCALEPLVAALQDEDADVREDAAFALGEMREAEAIEPLLAALSDRACAAAATEALQKLTGRKYRDPKQWQDWWAAFQGS